MFSLNMSSITDKTTTSTAEELPSTSVATTIEPSTLDTATTIDIEPVTTTAGTTTEPSTISTATTTKRTITLDATTPTVAAANKMTLASSISVGSVTVSSVPQMISSTVTINGQKLNKKSDSTKYNILSATSKMAANTLAVFDETDDISLETINFFNALGCTVLDSPTSDYTLMSEQTAKTTLENPNIETETSLRKSQKGKAGLSAAKSFPSTSDPFYDIDTTALRPETAATTESIISTVNLGSKAATLASDIATINTSKSFNSTVKQFQSPETTSESTPATTVSTTNAAFTMGR